MHIFMTNDDGFDTAGIVTLARELSSLGRITVIAPNRGRSSCSSSLSLHRYLRLWKKESYGENITVLSCNGTTADCCKLALEFYLRNDCPDLIVSGVNNGFNTGSDCLYSGTVAGAMEGVFLGIPAMAVSTETVNDQSFLERVCRFARDMAEVYFVQNAYKGILNVNIPKTEEERISWEFVKVVKLGLQRYDGVIREMKDPSGHVGFWLSGKALPDAMPDTDVFWAHRGHITVTPLTWNQTNGADLEIIGKMSMSH